MEEFRVVKTKTYGGFNIGEIEAYEIHWIRSDEEGRPYSAGVALAAATADELQLMARKMNDAFSRKTLNKEELNGEPPRMSLMMAIGKE